MLLVIESIILCLLFTLMVYIISRKPINTLYNYPPEIRKRVMSLEYYKGRISKSNNNKIIVKFIALIIFLFIMVFILRYINGYKGFIDAFKYGFLLWTIVNLYDLIVLDIIWFCHDPYFVFKGTEDMESEYHNYLFHFKGFIIGEFLAIIICFLSALIISFIG